MISQVEHRGGYQLLARRIDRRVCDLVKELVEVIVERTRLSERQARGASMPIEASGTDPVAAMGRITSWISSQW